MRHRHCRSLAGSIDSMDDTTAGVVAIGNLLAKVAAIIRAVQLLGAQLPYLVVPVARNQRTRSRVYPLPCIGKPVSVVIVVFRGYRYRYRCGTCGMVRPDTFLQLSAKGIGVGELVKFIGRIPSGSMNRNRLSNWHQLYLL